MKKYRTFVRRHRALLSAIEQGAAGMTWFIEGENSEVWAEAASSAVGVVSTLNDHLVADESDDDDEGDARSSPNRGEIDSAYGNESDGGAAPDGGIGDRRRGSARDAKPRGVRGAKARGSRRVPGALVSPCARRWRRCRR